MTDQHAPEIQAPPSHTALSYDRAMFREYVRELGLSSPQEDALLDAVWLIVVGVLDQRFGAQGFSDSATDAKCLADDSSGVLALMAASNNSNRKDAKALDRPIARRTDS